MDRVRLPTNHRRRLSSWVEPKNILSECQKFQDESQHFSTCDPSEVCKQHLHYVAVEAFLEWSCQVSNSTETSPLFTYVEAWRMAVTQHTRSPVDPVIKMDMKNVGEHVLILYRSAFRALLSAHFVLGSS